MASPRRLFALVVVAIAALAVFLLFPREPRVPDDRADRAEAPAPAAPAEAGLQPSPAPPPKPPPAPPNRDPAASGSAAVRVPPGELRVEVDLRDRRPADAIHVFIANESPGLTGAPVTAYWTALASPSWTVSTLQPLGKDAGIRSEEPAGDLLAFTVTRPEPGDYALVARSVRDERVALSAVVRVTVERGRGATVRLLVDRAVPPATLVARVTRGGAPSGAMVDVRSGALPVTSLQIRADADPPSAVVPGDEVLTVSVRSFFGSEVFEAPPSQSLRVGSGETKTVEFALPTGIEVHLRAGAAGGPDEPFSLSLWRHVEVGPPRYVQNLQMLALVATTTGWTGRLPEGRYTTRANAGGRVGLATFDVVGPGPVEARIDLRATTGPRLRFTVRDAEGAPLPKLACGFSRETDRLEDTWSTFPMTNEAGRFEVRDVAPGDYRFYAMGEFGKSRLLSVPASPAVQEIDLRLPAPVTHDAASIGGLVFGPSGPPLVRGAQILVQPRGSDWASYVTSDPLAKYRVRGLPAGDVTVRVEWSWYSPDPFRLFEKSLRLDPGDGNSLDVELRPP
jgi:hypothetical protein